MRRNRETQIASPRAITDGVPFVVVGILAGLRLSNPFVSSTKYRGTCRSRVVIFGSLGIHEREGIAFLRNIWLWCCILRLHTQESRLWRGYGSKSRFGLGTCRAGKRARGRCMTERLDFTAGANPGRIHFVAGDLNRRK